MATLNYVKKARKNYKEHGIKKGESYYWWKFRFGGKHFSKTRPRRSQLTQSSFFAAMYDAEDSVCDASADFSTGKLDLDGLADALDNAASDVRSAGEECESNRSNMPDALQDSETGQLLENRQQQCDSIADELENAAGEIRELTSDEETEEKKEEDVNRQAADLVEGISWDYE